VWWIGLGVKMSELDLLKQLKKANERIVSLCGTVNRYSEQLGLGRKVRAENWQIDANSLIKEALEQALAYFDSHSDADCNGDPPEFRPNKEMRLAMLMAQDALNAL
jgi:hypothetical protein